MANLNKENIITVDVKNATVSTQGNMTFYITDERTCNIYCQLVVNASKSALITKYHSVDNAEDFTVTLRLIKPNNEPKEIDFILLDKADAFFYIDLEEEYKDCIGTYKCELFVDTTVNGELERVTTSSFTYKVNGSIMNNLDEVIGGGPDYPLVKTMATRVYVDNSIAAIPETDLLSGFATIRYVDYAISEHENKIIIQDFASRDYVATMINGVKLDIEKAGYTTESYVNEEIVKLSNTIAQQKYVTENQMNNAINEAINSSDLSKYATQSYVNEAINNKTSYYDMRYATTSYVDTEVDEVFNYCASVRTILQNVIDEYADKNYVDTAIANAQLGGGEGGSVDTDNLAITNSLTVGSGCTASIYSVAHGMNSKAKGGYSHAEGLGTYADGLVSHTEGEATIAIGYASHAEGFNTRTNGDQSHAEGYYTIASGSTQHVQGRYNIEDTESKYAHIVGNGSNDYNPETETWSVTHSNAHTLDWDGNAWYAKDVYVGGTSQDDANKLATESYVDNAINNIEIPDVDLTAYATKEELNNALGDIESLLGEI